MSQELTFDSLSLTEVPVTLAGVSYVLQEASAGAGRDYRNAQVKTFKIQDGKMTGMEGMADLDLLLVSLCLFEKNTYKTVSLKTIQEWPDRIVKTLATKAKEISDLEDKDTAESIDKKISELNKKREAILSKENPAKNEPSATTPASV